MHDHRYGIKGTLCLKRVLYESLLASNMLNVYGMMSMIVKCSSLIVPYTTEKTTIETIDS